MVTTLWSDIRYSLRAMSRSPMFAVTAIVTLGLGIGANTAIFGLINAVIFETLPVVSAERLVHLTRVSGGGRPGAESYPLYELFRDNVRSVSGVFVHGTSDVSVSIDGEDELINVDLVSGSYYGVLGVQAAAGRLLVPADDAVSPAAPAAVIGDAYWARRFGRDPGAIGRSIDIGGRTFTIVGVTPPSYRGPTVGRASDLTLPILPMIGERRSNAGNNAFNVLARLEDGATVEQANAEVQALYGAFLQSYAAQLPENERAGFLRQRAAAIPGAAGFNPLKDDVGLPLFVLMGIVGCILLLASVNLAAMLLARGAARQKEVLVRLALGASRARLIMQLLTESLVLAFLGGSLGLLLSIWFSASLLRWFARGAELAVSVAPDARVLLFTAGVTLVACFVAGFAPAVQSARADLLRPIRSSAGRDRGVLRKTLVITQLALSMVLIVGATLFVGTLTKLYSVDRGFEADGLSLLYVLSSEAYSPERATAVRISLLERLAAMPGVSSASAAQVLPVGGNRWDRGVLIDERPAPQPEAVAFNAIAPRYFATIGTPLLAGREIDERDTRTNPRVAIVNESFERYFFGDSSALGKQVTSLDVRYEIVGVVRNTAYQDLREPVQRTMYIPWTQSEDTDPARFGYVVRTESGIPLSSTPALESAIRGTDPALHLRTVMPYDSLIQGSIAGERIMAALGGLFGLLAFLIAGIGLFGVLAYQVARRSNELGIRLVLGATSSIITRIVVRDVLTMLVPGIAIGTGIAYVLAGFARDMLFGLAPTEPLVFVAAASALAFAGVIAGWLPARRAAKLNPVDTLRVE